MQLTIDIGYDQVSQLVWQLPPRDREACERDRPIQTTKVFSREVETNFGQYGFSSHRSMSASSERL